MEEPESSKPWFITHDGERLGPYSMADLKAKVELHEINPRLDMAWKEGMDDWIPAGEVEGLFEKKASTDGPEKKETKSSDSAFTEYDYEDDDPTENVEHQEWDGVSRGGYFFFCYIFPLIWWVGLFFALNMLKEIIGADLLPIIAVCFAFLPVLIAIFAITKRFQNLAMSGLWFFGLIIPFLNIWLGYRLFACPPGYAEHKRLGGLGRVLAVIYWLPLVAAIGLMGMIAAKGPEMLNGYIEKNRAQYEQLRLKVEEMTETPEEAKAREAEQKAKEKAAKGPSIIPITR